MILQRYILRELVASYLFAFMTVLSVCLVGTMFQVFRTFPGLGFTILMKLMPLATGAMATWVMLVASCTSSTLIYARLAAENEITAMRTCGIHVSRIIAPALLLGLVLVGAAYPLNEYVVPWARFNRRLLGRDSVLYALKYLPPPGAQDFKIGAIRLTYLDFRDGRMEKPTISKYSHDQLHLVMEYVARSGTIQSDNGPLRVILTQPRFWQWNEQTGRQERLSAENDVTFELPTEDPDKAPRQLVDQPADVLWGKYFKSTDPEERNSILLILHTRYASSLAPLLLVLVAMPVGILVRRGSRLAGLGAALPPLLMYFITFFVFQGLGDKNRIPAVLAAYAPDLFLGLLAMVLVWGISRR